MTSTHQSYVEFLVTNRSLHSFHIQNNNCMLQTMEYTIPLQTWVACCIISSQYLECRFKFPTSGEKMEVVWLKPRNFCSIWACQFCLPCLNNSPWCTNSYPIPLCIVHGNTWIFDAWPVRALQFERIKNVDFTPQQIICECIYRLLNFAEFL